MKDFSIAYRDLIQFATGLFTKAGMPEDRAKIVAATLVEADLMGHSTHGLALLPSYVEEVLSGDMKVTGEPMVLSDHGAAITWDGQHLPGPWLVHRAIDLAFDRIANHPVVSVAIGQSHHIACLAAYAERVTSKGLMMMLVSSDPRNKTVAPFGGLVGVYSPNPLAVGIPTHEDPIIIDISMSTTTNGLVNRSFQRKEKLPHRWLQDAKGMATDDPATFKENPPATIFPLGGEDTGYKGFALGILMEALTSGLAGQGRADNPSKWTASVFLQISNPEAFGGLQQFKEQNQFLINASLASTPKDNTNPVRLPGARGLELKRKQLNEGVTLHTGIVEALNACAIKYNVVPLSQH